MGKPAAKAPRKHFRPDWLDIVGPNEIPEDTERKSHLPLYAPRSDPARATAITVRHPKFLTTYRLI